MSKIIPLHQERSWKPKALLLCNLIAAILLISLYWPLTHPFWTKIDTFFFHLINQTLVNHPWWQTLWALASHKNADWVEDLFILGFFAHYYRKAPQGGQRTRLAQIFFVTLYCGLVILLINRIFLREYLNLHRYSPSLCCSGAFLLSDAVTWVHFKDTSTSCFPGDHATTAILFASSYSYFAGKKWGVISCLFAAILCFPRLITGAHWLSDILVGSGSIALIFLSWAFCSPLYPCCEDYLKRFFSRLIPSKDKKTTTLYASKGRQ